jgi:hypothetical protein
LVLAFFNDFVGEIVLCVHIAESGFSCCWFKATITAYVEPHGTFERANVSILDCDSVAFVDFVYVLIPEGHVDCSSLISD